MFTLSINAENRPTTQQREILQAAHRDHLFRELASHRTFSNKGSDEMEGMAHTKIFPVHRIAVMLENGWLEVVIPTNASRPAVVPVKLTAPGRAALGVK